MRNHCIFILALTTTVVGVFASAAVLAHDNPPVFDRVSVSASAEDQVDNDLLIAVLFAEHQAQKQRTVSEFVNEAIQWAIAKAKTRDVVKVQTTQYNTSPTYKKSIITGWRARQSIRLESRDADAMSELIGELQERLAIASVNYGVSKQNRDAAEDALIARALAQFKHRATLIATELKRAGYRIVQLNVNTQGGHRPPVYAYRSAALEDASAASAPAIEAGEQTISVTVNGTIELDSAR